MSIGSNWYIFGPAAICWAVGRRLPPVVDAYITTFRPDRALLTTLLKTDELPTVRYATEEPEQIINLDNVKLEPVNSDFAIIDPESVLEKKRIHVRNYQLSLMQSLRLRYAASLFSEFEWPDYLIKKLECDLEYARIAADRDAALHLSLLNLNYDFGLTIGESL